MPSNFVLKRICRGKHDCLVLGVRKCRLVLQFSRDLVNWLIFSWGWWFDSGSGFEYVGFKYLNLTYYLPPRYNRTYIAALPLASAVHFEHIPGYLLRYFTDCFLVPVFCDLVEVHDKDTFIGINERLRGCWLGLDFKHVICWVDVHSSLAFVCETQYWHDSSMSQDNRQGQMSDVSVINHI